MFRKNGFLEKNLYLRVKDPLKVAQKSFLLFFYFILFIFLRLLEIDTIFQAWNCTVSNGCACFMVTLQLYLSLCLSHKLRWGC